MSKSLFGGNISVGQATVTTSAARIVAQSDAAPRANGGVVVKALSGNSATVYIGADDGITSSNSYPLAAGETLTVPVDDLSKLFALAGSGSQVVAYLYI